MVAPLMPDVGSKLEADLQAVLADVRALVAERDRLRLRVEALESEMNPQDVLAVDARLAITWKVAAGGVKEAWVGRLIRGWIFSVGETWCGNVLDGTLMEFPTEADAKAFVEEAVCNA